MTLTINRLDTLCRAPREVEGSRALVDGVAKGSLASDVTALLGPSLDRVPAVVRMKQLRVKLKVSARELNKTKLSSVWARALVVALHRALARPDDDGTTGLRRYQTNAAYKAAMLHHIAINGLAPRWEFPDLDEWHGTRPAQAALAVLLAEPGLIAEILVQLGRQDWLDSVLALWDELSLERVMRAVAGRNLEADRLSFANLLDVGRAAAAAGGIRRGWLLADRRQAIRLWLRLHRRVPLGGVWDGLRLAVILLERPELLTSGDWPLPADAIPLVRRWAAMVRELAAPSKDARASSAAGGAPTLQDLRSVLESLRAYVPSAASRTRTSQMPAKWITSDRVGVLLMLSVARRLDLWRFAQAPEFVRYGGPRAVSFLLAGIGMTFFKDWSAGDAIDPAVALFAGMFGDPDHAGMRRFFDEADVGAVAEFAEAATWPDALQGAATELARSFASRVRGFRNASRQAVVKQFLHVLGRVLVEEDRVLVVIEPTPWAVALHLSSMDATLERMEWLGTRRVEFALQGL